MGADASVMLDTLLELQDRDTAIDRLRHRRDTLPERAALESVQRELSAAREQLSEATAERDEVLREERRFDDEARSLEERAADVERRMYSGEVTSPRELQTMQADVEQLRRHQGGLEDRELAIMERREQLDTRVSAIEARAGELGGEESRLAAVVSELEGEIDEELGGERAARDQLAATIDVDLREDYEDCRQRARGMGAARLNGNTCQGCHLAIPSVEAERIRKSPSGTIAHCDNCGCILVP